MVKILNFILISHTIPVYTIPYHTILTSFPVFYKNIFCYWSQHFTVSVDLPSCILSSFLWYDKDILISNKPIYFKHFSNNNLNYVTQLFDDTGNTKEWMKLKHEFNLNNNLYFKWMQLIHSIPQKWKNAIKNNRISENLLFWTTIWQNIKFYFALKN